MRQIQIYLLVTVLGFTACQGDGKQEKAQKQSHHHSEHKHDHQGHSPYAGQQKRQLKAFPSKMIKQLKEGSGMPFYGMAKPAELNSYPGPKHILQGKKQLGLSAKQQDQIQQIYDSMDQRAEALGDSLLANERKMEKAFSTGRITREKLRYLVNRSGALYGKLRFSHLQAHLKAKQVLNKEQIEQYNEWRGYN